MCKAPRVGEAGDLEREGGRERGQECICIVVVITACVCGFECAHLV